MKRWQLLNALVAACLALATSASGQATPYGMSSPAVEQGPASGAPSASGAVAALSPAQHDLAVSFIAAVNSKNIDAMRRLVMPEALACYAQNTRPYLDEFIKPYFRNTIPENYRASFSPFLGKVKASRFYTWPAEPTGLLTLEYSQGKGTTKLIHRVRDENGKLYLALPCLTQKGVELFAATVSRRAAKIEKAREAYKGLHDPLRSQLTKLLNEHKYQEAFMSCRDGLKVDSLTARYVLELLAGREPGSGFATAPSAAPTSHQ